MPAMSDDTPDSAHDKTPRPAAQVVIAGLLVPGGAQFLQGRRSHAALLGGVTIALFVAGMVISNFTAIDRANHDLYFIMQALNPLLTFGSIFGGLVKEPLIGETISVHEQTIGIAFTATAGLLNLLCVLEALRHAPELEIFESDDEEGAA